MVYLKFRKGYIDLEDLKKINTIFNHFNEDDLEGRENLVIIYTNRALRDSGEIR